jgi:tripartite-type tricarboxylate transporter receptor subunit TctC
MDRRRFIATSAGLALAARAGAARAQSGPLTRLIYPFAGGAGDATCRLLAEHLRAPLDRNFIVENRTGADGRIGIKSVMSAPSDGATILITTGPTMYLLPMVEATPSFDHARDFVPVSLLGRYEFCLATGAGTDARDFRQLVAWLKANPAKSSFGVPSNGTIPHFTGSRLEQVLGIAMTRVPYRGGAPVVKDLIGGHLPFGILALSDAIAQHQAGDVRIVAVSSEMRSPFVPEVATLKENGIDLVAEAWLGMWLPAGSSTQFAQQLSALVAAVLAKPEVKGKLLAIGLIPVGSTPEAVTQELAANTAFWQPIVQATGYKIAN